MRTGLQAFAKLIKSFCRLMIRHRATIEAAIQALSISSGDKARLLEIVETLDGACRIANVLLNRTER